MFGGGADDCIEGIEEVGYRNWDDEEVGLCGLDLCDYSGGR